MDFDSCVVVGGRFCVKVRAAGDGNGHFSPDFDVKVALQGAAGVKVQLKPGGVSSQASADLLRTEPEFVSEHTGNPP